MSAFFVSPATISDAAYALIHDTPAGSPFDNMRVHFLGQLLMQLNALALHERYGDEIEGEHLAAIVAFTEDDRPMASDNEWQRFKSLSCLIYQCDEGSVPETDLFKAMDAARDAIAKRLTGKSDAGDALTAAYDHPDYNQAGWGRN